MKTWNLLTPFSSVLAWEKMRSGECVCFNFLEYSWRHVGGHIWTTLSSTQILKAESIISKTEGSCSWANQISWVYTKYLHGLEMSSSESKSKLISKVINGRYALFQSRTNLLMWMAENITKWDQHWRLQVLIGCYFNYSLQLQTGYASKFH